MWFLVPAFVGIVLGSLSGLVSALYLTGMTDNGLRRDQPVYVDGWVSDWSIGSEASGRYLKAWVARRGLLAMRKSEAVYFNRSTDNDGAPLRESCRYLVSGADLMIYDCTYTDDEFPRYVGFGHSTWQEGIRICEDAGVKQLAIFHHAPEHDDDFLDHVAVAAERARKGTVVAREGQMLELT